MVDQDTKIRLSQSIAKVFGIHFHENQWSSLERYLKNIAKELNIADDIESLSRFLSKNSFSEIEFDALSKHLTVGETYFFRENVALQLFSKEIIPALICERTGNEQRISIWCAGCSSGEEPYTLAMILKELIWDINYWRIDILATDVNTDALRRAKAGTFPAWSFRETSDEMKQKYFTKNGKHFEISSEIRQMVTFKKLNLANDVFPSETNSTQNFDVIFCRNVLMYFLPEKAKEVAGQFFAALNENGWLITSQVELNDEYFSPFARKMFEHGIFYQKTEIVQEQNNYDALVRAVKPMNKKGLKPSTKKIAAKKKQVATTPKRKNSVKQVVASSHVLNTMNAARLFADARYVECAAWCERYLAANPFDKQIALLLIKSCANAGKLNDAKRWIERLIPVDGANAENMYLYATILMEQNDWETAEKALIKTLYLNPVHPAANFNLANTMKRLGKIKPAIKYYANLLNLLDNLDDNEVVPELDGMTAGRLRQIIELMIK
jgi:chemotaxis protein methyltransferase CheR